MGSDNTQKNIWYMQTKSQAIATSLQTYQLIQTAVNKLQVYKRPKRSKVCQKYPPMPLHHPQSKLLTRGRMDPYFHVIQAKF